MSWLRAVGTMTIFVGALGLAFLATVKVAPALVDLLVRLVLALRGG